MPTFGRRILFACFWSQIATEIERMLFWITLFGRALEQFSRFPRARECTYCIILIISFSRGYVQNCVDEMGWRCNGLCRPAVTNWKSVYIVPGQQESV